MHLAITGADAARFSGECTVSSASGEQTIALEGSVPLERDFSGDAIACRIRQTSDDGYLQVELRAQGNVSRSRTQGKGSIVNLSLRSKRAR